jgi:class 3 adenylate cyclase
MKPRAHVPCPRTTQVKGSADDCARACFCSSQVQLKAGLHSGWVIEGAVGSSHKIDASYLSPHVNMAARIETATFQVRCIVSVVCTKTPSSAPATSDRLE